MTAPPFANGGTKSPLSRSPPPLDWCRDVLPRVSRTFALGIRMLPDPWEPWVTVGYLLCRVVDTVEDAPDLPWPDRRELFRRFEEALEGGPSRPFLEIAERLPAGEDGVLARRLDRMLVSLESFPSEARDPIRRWVGEMAYGMALYSRRRARGDGLCALDDAADLRRYCWYVAGTVGRLLTDLFCAGSPAVGECRRDLLAHAEGFGLLLQLTNIVKDVTDDAERGWMFVPRASCVSRGILPEDLLVPAHRDRALAAVGDVVEMAKGYVPDAIRYVVSLPREEDGLRRFCLVPMILAVRTLALAEGNPAVLTPGAPVKVDRATVAQVVDQVERLLGDDAAIQALALPQ